jgi:diketogulonate reductase-like aldo/keto reductase
MEHRQFGPLQAQVSVIGQGSWYIARGDRTRAITALRRGLDLGMNHIDTAEMYDGAEALIGEAIAGRRDEAFLVSKVLPSNASRERTRRACEKSLAKLKTDRLDCYLLHWRGEHPLAETFEALAALKQEGKILSYGVSNFDAEDLREALAITGKGKIVCNQVLYHLQQRAIEHEVIPFCEKNDIAVVAYSPFGQDNFPAPNSAGGKVLGEIAAKRHLERLHRTERAGLGGPWLKGDARGLQRLLQLRTDLFDHAARRQILRYRGRRQHDRCEQQMRQLAHRPLRIAAPFML